MKNLWEVRVGYVVFENGKAVEDVSYHYGWVRLVKLVHTKL